MTFDDYIRAIMKPAVENLEHRKGMTAEEIAEESDGLLALHRAIMRWVKDRDT